METIGRTPCEIAGRSRKSPTAFKRKLRFNSIPVGTGVTLVHRVTRLGGDAGDSGAVGALGHGAPAAWPWCRSRRWGSTRAIFCPNRNLVLWPYTDMSDPRWHFGKKYILLRQDSARGPTKIGFVASTRLVRIFGRRSVFSKKYGLGSGGELSGQRMQSGNFHQPRGCSNSKASDRSRSLGDGESLEHSCRTMGIA